MNTGNTHHGLRATLLTFLLKQQGWECEELRNRAQKRRQNLREERSLFTCSFIQPNTH